MIDLGNKTVTCEGCGACCMHIGIPPFGEWNGDTEDPEFDALPEELRQEILDRTEEESWAFKQCLWFDRETRRCKHYDLRPLICVAFEPGNPVCLEDIKVAVKRGLVILEVHVTGE